MYRAYETLKEITTDETIHSDEHRRRKEQEEEAIWDEWLRWAGRWGKRMLRSNTDVETLRIRIPWKILEDRSESFKIEYDGWPQRVPLVHTETIGIGGLRIRLIPNAEWTREIKTGISGEDLSITERCKDPWYKETEWLFEIPTDAVAFRVLGGGEWSKTPGIYGRGIHWFYSATMNTS